jgi:glucosylceramidase
MREQFYNGIGYNHSFFATKSKTTTKYFSTKGKAVHVYTSGGQDLRLTKTDNLQFTDLNQPLETQLCVLLIQLKHFKHTWVGVAITDASASFC